MKNMAIQQLENTVTPPPFSSSPLRESDMGDMALAHTQTPPAIERSPGPSGDPQPALDFNAQLSTSGSRASANPQPLFPRRAGETPRAYNAFITWFELGHSRSHQTVADKLGEGLATVKNWASKYDWSDRWQAFNEGLAQQHAADIADRQRKQIADWSDRLNRFREQEWDAAQKLLSAAQCFLESFGEEALENMTLSQVSRALRISSQIARSALAGLELPASSEPVLVPLQQQMLEALKRLSASSPVAAGVPPAVEPGVPPGGAHSV
jgi:hypothetical protein